MSGDPADVRDSGDPIWELMKRRGLPLTREVYLNLEYLGKPPKELHPEAEGMLPEELQEPDSVPQRRKSR